MDTSDYIRLLRGGKIEEWNAIRAETREFPSFERQNLSNVDLSKANLSGLNLSEVKFIHTTLNSTVFDHAILDSAKFSCCSGDNTSFRSVVGQCIDFRGSHLVRAVFSHGRIQEADFVRRCCSNVVLRERTLRDRIFHLPGLNRVTSPERVYPSLRWMERRC